jgi:hypothetical protein
MVAALCLVTLFGVGYCYFGVITRTSLVKRLLMGLSILGVLTLPIASYTRPNDSVVFISRCLAGWSALIFINTLAAFYCMDSRTVTAGE